MPCLNLLTLAALVVSLAIVTATASAETVPAGQMSSPLMLAQLNKKGGDPCPVNGSQCMFNCGPGRCSVATCVAGKWKYRNPGHCGGPGGKFCGYQPCPTPGV